MSTPILATKLYIPPPRPEVVLRPRLIERLNEALPSQSGDFARKLTLISAPAGFGKTTLVSEWVHAVGRASPPIAAAWLSLDEGDSDPTRFLAYLVAALQTLALSEVEGIAPSVGERVLAVLQSPQPPPTESILTALLNEIATIPDSFVLILDDYHAIDAQSVDASTSVDGALTFILEHLPPHVHLVIATRENPPLPLARLRAQGQLTELRATDLRFTPAEAAEFLNQVMGLSLSAEDVAALETRTEGWIAGLQLAALAVRSLGSPRSVRSPQGTISIQGHKDVTRFIQTFTGSHRFVLDYLVEEVLQQQSESIQNFLLCTSILDRLCGPLCDAVCSVGSAVRRGGADLHLTPAASGQETLEYLERANLFIVPLDNERRWYRYHHLFADLLRQRLQQEPPSLSSPSLGGTEGGHVAELHRRASVWYEANGLEIEAFHHAAAANDVERAARLAEGEGMPLHFRGAVAPVLNWLESLPATVLDARPSLWVMYASALSIAGQNTGVEGKLQAAEAALAGSAALCGVEPDDVTRDLIGRIAAIRAMLAAPEYEVETIIAQSRRALEYLHPDNLPVRTSANWTLGFAYQLRGDRAAASQAYTETISICQASGNFFINILATTSLGIIQESENQLHLAAETYRRVLQLVGDPPLPAACEAYLGLARIFYEWNDLDVAQQYGQQGVELARQIENIDSSVAGEVFLARLKLAQGDMDGAAAILAKADESARQHNFVQQIPEVAAAQVRALLWQGPLLRQRPLLPQGDLAAAADLAEKHGLPISQARVHLAQGDPGAALAVLEPLRQEMQAKGWVDKRLQVMVLQAVAHYAAALQADGETEVAVQVLGEALALAEPGGFIRTFVDEGMPMAQLLSEAGARGIMPDYTRKLLAAYEDTTKDEQRGTKEKVPSFVVRPSSLVEPLSQRELEVLQLIAQGLSNREISERLFIALDTVKGHNRRIYGKLQVQRRTEAVARARELGLV